MTPKKLQVAVNTEILPDLGITPKKPIGTCTARRWLIKLGWRYTEVKKGVYMDGHKRVDVVKYRREVFLPLMAKFEARMVHYEGPELQLGITTGFGNPRVSARVCLGLGYGLEIFTPVKTRTPATGWRV